MLYAGEGVAKDPVEAFAYLYLAAKDPGNDKACAGVVFVERELCQNQRDIAKARSREMEQSSQCSR